MAKLFINSLPKSGTHLVGKLVELMAVEFSRVNFSSSSIYGRYSIAKSLLRGPMFGQPGIEVGLDIPSIVRSSWVEASLKRTRNGMYCGGHAPYSDCLHTLLKENGCRTIYVVRDPRDVIVSWAHYVPTVAWHYGLNGLHGLPLEERVKRILDGYRSGRFIIESFSNVLARSSGWMNKADVLTIRFEDLVGAKGGGDDLKQLQTIEKVGSFVGRSTYEAVSIVEQLFGGTKVFRKGKIGSYKEELPEGVIEEINAKLAGYIIDMGYQK